MLIGNGNNNLLFSSYWSGTATIAQTINGGNINVRSNFPSSGPPVTQVAHEPEFKPVDITSFNVRAYPNPAEHQFNLVIEGGSNEKVLLIVRDIMGRVIKQIEKTDGQPIRFGEDLKTGIYMAEIRQGINRRTIKLIKQ